MLNKSQTLVDSSYQLSAKSPSNLHSPHANNSVPIFDYRRLTADGLRHHKTFSADPNYRKAGGKPPDSSVGMNAAAALAA